MASRFVLPFADVGSGIKPSDGAKLTFKNPGLETLKDTFSDAAGTIANTNPVIADATGLFSNIYINGENDVVLQDKNNVQIWADSVVEFQGGNVTSTNGTSRSLVGWVDGQARQYDSVAALKAETVLSVGDFILIQSYDAVIQSTPMQGEIVAGGTGTDDGGEFIDLAGSSLQFKQHFRGVFDVTQFGALGDNSNDDTAAIQAAFNAMGEFEALYFPPGQYYVTATINMEGRKNFSVKGEFRASKLKVDHSGEAAISLENESFQTGGIPQRGILIENISIYAFSSTSLLPTHGLQIVNCPEIKLANNTFIDCATVSCLSIDECWDAVVEWNFFSARENLVATHGAPNNTSSGGRAILVPTECHAMTISYNRIRTGSPGIDYGGGDATEIRLNAIESNLTNGIEVTGSCQAITISYNYFEGAQLFDVVYSASGTNFSHKITGNYFHAVGGVKVLSGCDCNNLSITKNQFFSGSKSIEFESGMTFKTITIEDNLHREQALTYDFTTSDFSNIGLKYPSNRISINDSEVGATFGPNAFPSFNLLEISGAAWQTFSGAGTSPNATINHAGILMYDLTSASSWAAFNEYKFDNSMQDAYITVQIPIISTGATNFVVNIDDGVNNRNYTCNSETVTNGAADNVLYFRTDVAATRIRIRVTIGTETIQVLVPTVLKGLHKNLSYRDQR